MRFNAIKLIIKIIKELVHKAITQAFKSMRCKNTVTLVSKEDTERAPITIPIIIPTIIPIIDKKIVSA